MLYNLQQGQCNLNKEQLSIIILRLDYHHYSDDLSLPGQYKKKKKTRKKKKPPPPAPPPTTTTKTSGTESTGGSMSYNDGRS